MQKYTVVIHYEGAIDYLIEADNEEEAKDKASELMMNEEANKILDGLDWEVCDVWKE